MTRAELIARLVNAHVALEGPKPPVATVARHIRALVDELNRGSVEGFPVPSAVAHALAEPLTLPTTHRRFSDV